MFEFCSHREETTPWRAIYSCGARPDAELFIEACSREQQLFQLTWNLLPKALAVGWLPADQRPTQICSLDTQILLLVRSKLLIVMVRPE